MPNDNAISVSVKGKDKAPNREKSEPQAYLGVTEDVGIRIWAAKVQGRLTASPLLTYRPFPTKLTFRRKKNSILAYQVGYLMLGWAYAWEYLIAHNQDCPPLPPSFAAFKAELEKQLAESIAAKEAENLAAIAAQGEKKDEL